MKPTLPSPLKASRGRILSASLLFGTLALPAFGQTTSYYWNTTGPGNIQSNWGINTDGSGSSPGNFFSTPDLRLRIQNGQDLNNFSGNWAVAGDNSEVVVESGGTITASGRNHNIVLNMESNAVYEVSSGYSNLSFNSINPGSTFILSGNLSSIRSDLTYGGFSYNSSASGTDATSLTLTGALNVNQGTLRASGFTSSGAHDIGGGVTIQSGAAYQFGTTTNTGLTSTINVGGGLTNNGDFSNPSATLAATLNFNGAGSSNVQWGTHAGTFAVNVGVNKNITFQDSLVTSGGDVGVAGALVVNDGQSVNAGAGSITVDGTLSGASTAGGVMTLSSTTDVTFSDGSVISLALGDGANSALALAGGGAFLFDSDQGILFLDDGATTGTYENIVTGLSSDPGVSGWTVLNDGWSGTFTFDGSNVDFNLATIPEPHLSAMFFGAMISGLVVFARRRCNRA